MTLVAAQRLVPGKTGIASGLILGLGFVTGGIGVPVSGYVADTAGFDAAYMMLAFLTSVAVLIALSIPKRALDYVSEPNLASEPTDRYQPTAQPATERAS